MTVPAQYSIALDPRKESLGRRLGLGVVSRGRGIDHYVPSSGIVCWMCWTHHPYMVTIEGFLIWPAWRSSPLPETTQQGAGPSTARTL